MKITAVSLTAIYKRDINININKTITKKLFKLQNTTISLVIFSDEELCPYGPVFPYVLIEKGEFRWHISASDNRVPGGLKKKKKKGREIGRENREEEGLGLGLGGKKNRNIRRRG